MQMAVATLFNLAKGKIETSMKFGKQLIIT